MAQAPNDSLPQNDESKGAAGLDTFFRQGQVAAATPPTSSASSGLDTFFRQDEAAKQVAAVRSSASSRISAKPGAPATIPADITDPAARDNLSRFLTAIGTSEGADYNTVVGGSKFDDMSRHPGITGLVTKDGPSTAAGRYQITGTTYRDVAPKIGVSDFSPESQDRIAIALLQRRGALDDVLKGDYRTAVGKLGDEWQSLPSGTSKNQGKRSWEFFDQALSVMTGSKDAQAGTVNDAAKPSSFANAPKWSAVIAKPAYQALSDAEKAEARTEYFETFLAPDVAPNQRDQLRSWFDQQTAKAETKPGMLEQAGTMLGKAGSAIKNLYTTPAGAPVEGAQYDMNGIDVSGNSGQGAVRAPELMDGAKAGPASTVPVSPGYRAQFNAAWDSATPAQRAQMAQRTDVAGRLAQERNAQTEGLTSNATTDRLDPRAEARSRQLVKGGMDGAQAQDWARNAAATNVMPGQEIGQAEVSKFDFDAQKKFNESKFYSNPVVRGAVKGYEGFKVGSLGVNQFVGEVLGADDFAETMASGARQSKRFTEGMGDPKNYGQRMFEGAVSSVAQQLPSMLGGAVTGSQALVLGSMFMQSFGQEYAEGRGAGQTIGDATQRAALFGAFEVIGEKAGLKFQMDKIRQATQGMPADILKGWMENTLKKELPGEMLTTTGQFITDKSAIGLRQNAGVGDYLGQMADTVVATLMQSGIMAGGTSGVANAVQYAKGRGESAGLASTRAEAARTDALSKWEAFRQQTANNRPATPTTAPAGSAPAMAPAAAVAPVAATDMPDAALQPQDILDYAEARRDALHAKRDGQVEQVLGEDGEVKEIDIAGEGLSREEIAELHAIEGAEGNATILSQLYGFDQPTGANNDQGARNANDVSGGNGPGGSNPATAGLQSIDGAGSTGDAALAGAGARNENAGVGTAAAVSTDLSGANSATDQQSALKETANVPQSPQAGQETEVAQGAQAAPQAPATAGVTERNATPILLPDGRRVSAQWQVVDADSVQASIKEGVSQPRDRTRASSSVQIRSIANNPDFERLSDTSKAMDLGAPTLDKGGLIVGGNGRFEGIAQAYANGTANEYLAALQANAERLGVDPASFANMKKPILVRRVTEDFDTRTLAIASNQTAGLQMSDMEQAAQDAERMTQLDQVQVTDTGDIPLTSNNIATIRDSLKGYSTEEQAGFMGADGKLSQSGVRRLRNAIMFKAYGKTETLVRLLESPDVDMKNIGTALVRAAGRLSKVRDGIKEGSIPAEYDIADDLNAAIEALSKIRAENRDIKEYLSQLGMFGDELSNSGATILLTLSENLRSANAIAQFLQRYAEAVMSAGTATGGFFDDTPLPNKKETLENARQQSSTPTAASQGGIFDQPGSAPGQPDRQQSGSEESPVAGNGAVGNEVAQPEVKAAPKTEKQKKAERAARAAAPAVEMGFAVGDTITLNRTVGYITAGKPMKVERIEGGEVFVFSGTGRTSESLAVLLSLHRQQPLVTVQKAVAETAATKPAPKTEAEAAARREEAAAKSDKHDGKWFGTADKARDYINKHKLAVSHTVQQEGKSRFNIVAKTEHDKGMEKLAEKWAEQDKEEGRPPARTARVPVNVDSVETFTAALMAGQVATLPNGRQVRLTQTEKHGWNYAANYADMPGIWAEGTRSVVPGVTLTQSKDTAIAKAVDEFERVLTKAKPAAENKPAPTATDGAPDESSKAAEYQGPHFASGQAAYREGKPRTLPSYFTANTGKNPKDWFRGYDAAKAEQATENKPAGKQDLDAMFDEIMAEDAEKVPAKPAPKTEKALKAEREQDGTDAIGSAKRRLREAKAAGNEAKVAEVEREIRQLRNAVLNGMAGEQAQADAAPAPTRTTTAAAGSAIKNSAAGFTNAIDGLGELFGGNKGGTLGSGPVLNEETYAKAKPLFQAAIANFADAGADIKEVMRAVINAVKAKFNSEVVANMKPYIVRFIGEYEQKKDAVTLTLRDTFYAMLKAGSMPSDNNNLRKVVETFDGGKVDNARLKQAQEDLEAAIARHARDIVKEGGSDKRIFDTLLAMYQDQPNLNIRTSTSIENQAYSTPAPLAFLAARLAHIDGNATVYEPTAGNGMLLLTAEPRNATANELEDQRFGNLKAQGFKATQGDALQSQLAEKSQDAVITNPPFGSVKDDNGTATKVVVDGYKLGKIDHLIAARALATMKNDGFSTLILGADKVTGGISNDDRVFFNWLYGNYNVTSHFEVEGKLYARQGANWPVRVITVAGRQKSDRITPQAGTIERASTWSEVYGQFEKGLGAQDRATEQTDAAGGGRKLADDSGATPAADGGQNPGAVSTGRPGGSKVGNGDVGGVVSGTGDDRAAQQPGALAGRADDVRYDGNGAGDDRLGQGGAGKNGSTVEGDSGATTGTDLEKPDRKPVADIALADAENQFQIPYTPRSTNQDEGVLVPVNMAQPMQDALLALEDEVGSIDAYAVKELGYPDTAALHKALMGLQVDSVASAIYNIKNGNKATIIADQTGIGKGRQAASMLRWALKNNYVPVFISLKPQLFTDMYSDLHDIGSDDIKPLIMNVGEVIKSESGESLFANKAGKHRAILSNIAATGQLPAGSNALFLTYSQINVANIQRQALMALGERAIIVMDESHNAAGESSTGEYVRGLLDVAPGVTYLSATFAKRPDNMPLYFKTDMGAAIADNSTLLDAMASGGLPLQTVISNNLVKAGQLFRRERSYDGVSIETRVDTAGRVKHEQISDLATEALRAIVAADKRFHEGYFKELKKQMEESGGAAIDNAGNQAGASVNHTEFSSVVHNFIRQMQLGLKVEATAKEVIASIKRGERPLVALENTMGSFLAEYVATNGLKDGDSLSGFDYRTVLSRALDRTRYVTKQLPNGDKVKEYVPLSKLPESIRAEYQRAQRVIDNMEIDIPVSPLDYIRNTVQQAGYSIAEITGRDFAVDYSTKVPTLAKVPAIEVNDKVNTTRKFNDGSLDAIILNVAGSTGISLHASSKFADQRQRHMIVVQPAQDINVFMQMLGRIHRTGQVVLPKYTMLTLDLPSEKRPTAVLSRKMKSLNANTSSNTESATSIKSADMLNKYGDQIIEDYLRENGDLAFTLGIVKDTPKEDLARTATGRMALLPVADQMAFYSDVEDQYHALIDYLNKTNQNDLEPRTFDYDAKPTTEIVFTPESNSKSPFGAASIYGEYSIKAQGKPMKPEEIDNAIKESLGGQTAKEHGQQLTNRLTGLAVTAINANRIKLAEAGKEFADGNTYTVAQVQNNPLTAEQYARSGGKESAGPGRWFISDHPIGSMWRVEVNGDVMTGVITNLKGGDKAVGNPFSMSKIQVVMAVNSPLRSISVPASQWSKIEIAHVAGTRIADAFRESAETRGTAKIITGNLLSAYGEMSGTGGTIIAFTKQDGNVEQGILLPKKFDMKLNTRGDYLFKTAADALQFLQDSNHKDALQFGISSRDGIVRVLRDGNSIKVSVPKSKMRGGKYFLDKGLLALTGDFVSSGSMMNATVTGKASLPVITYLMKWAPFYAAPSLAAEARKVLNDPLPPGMDAPVFSRQTGGLQTDTPAFKEWFDDSRVVDAEGKPLVVYHGTPFGKIEQFSVSELMNESNAFFFSESKEVADQFASGEFLDWENENEISPTVESVYLSIKNPAVYAGNVNDEVTIDQLFEGLGLSATDIPRSLRDFQGQDERPVWVWYTGESDVFGELKKLGFDGFISTEKGSRVFAAFSPSQIEFSSSKNGNFAPVNPSIALGRDMDGAATLQAIAAIDSAFSLPISRNDTVESITQDIRPDIKVRKISNIPGETRYQFDLPDGSMARMMVRPFNKYGNSLYGFDLNDGEMVNRDTDRPGKNAEEVEGKDDVWLDVSLLNEGSGFGGPLYNIAANYAHNTGKVFIGDPAGITDEALRRRPEQMLSSALKFGTTEHLAPHPHQVTGKRRAGIAPLDWIYGDHVGNIQKLIDVNIKNIDNQGGNGGIQYDATNGLFTDADGTVLTRTDIRELAKAGLGREANAGGTTLARYALLKSLVQGEGRSGRSGNRRPDALLESLVQQLRNHVSAVDQGTGQLKEIFYKRDSSNNLSSEPDDSGSHLDNIKAEVAALSKAWKNAPKITVVQSVRDLPFSAPRNAQGAYLNNQAWLVADNLIDAKAAQTVLFHEVLGHAGLRGLFGDQLHDQMRAIAEKNKSIRVAAEKWRAENADIRNGRGDALWFALSVEEALADAAGQGRTITGLDKLMAAMQSALRAIGLHRAANWLENASQAEVLTLLSKAQQHIEGKAPQSVRSEQALPAFTRDNSDGLENQRSITDFTRKELIAHYGNPNQKNVSGWDKSVGTMLNLAEKQPAFKKVFDVALDRETAVSITSLRPAELAPGVLPRNDSFGGNLKTLALGRTKYKQMQHATDAIIAGTLHADSVIDGQVWSDTELRERFGADQTGIALYKQMRAAIDASLDEVAAAEAYAALQMEVPRSVRARVLDDPANAQAILRAAIDRKIMLSTMRINDLERRDASQNAIDQAHRDADASKQARDTAIKIFDHAQLLKEGGYAPLMRFGKHGVWAEQVDASGKVVIDPESGKPATLYFGRFETAAEAKAEYYKLSIKYDGSNVAVRVGPINDDKHKLYGGMSPETLSLFAETLGKQDAMKAIYQHVVSERSALKRRLQRNSIAGYSEDMPRILSNFITSNARNASQNYYNRDFLSAIKYIPREKADIQKQAQALKTFLDNPDNVGAIGSSAAFAMFIAGNIGSVITNATQPIMMTIPALSAHTSAANAAAQVLKAYPQARTKKELNDPALRAALRRASLEGKVDAQEIFHLYATGIQGLVGGMTKVASKIPLIGSIVATGGDNLRARGDALLTLAGMPFSYIESVNRRVTFIAAWNIAQQNNLPDPYRFAVSMVDQTQGIYNKVNRPAWARSAVGRNLMIFTQFKIMAVELIKRMWTQGGPQGKKAAVLSVAMLILAAGAGGVPFADDLDDLIDTLGQFMGFDTNMKRNKRKWAHETLGKFWGDFALYGATANVPFDMAGRLGLGNMIPATGIAKLSNADNVKNELTELAGPAWGGIGKMALEAYDQAALGNWGKAGMALAPTAIKNAAAGAEMMATGKAKDMKGRAKTDVTKGEAALKTIGLNPTVVAEKNRANTPIQQDLALQRLVEKDIVEMWAQGIASNDTAMQSQAQKKLEDWNRKNPDTPVAITGRQITGRVKALLVPANVRMLKAAPKEMRGRVAAGLDTLE